MEFNNRSVNIYYEIKGSGKPVIMIHGFSVDHTLMAGSMEPVFENHPGYKRVYFDLPGMGRSQCADWISNSDVMLDFVEEFVRSLFPNERFLLAGESYGGYLSRGLLGRMADRIDGLLLICPVIYADRKMRNLPRHSVLIRDEELLSSLKTEDAKAVDNNLVVQSKSIYDKYNVNILSGIRKANKDFCNKLGSDGYEFSFDADKQFIEYVKPTLMLLGKQDSVVGYADAWEILEKYPRATFAVLDMAGHNLQIEQEALFTSLVLEWLRRVEEYQANP